MANAFRVFPGLMLATGLAITSNASAQPTVVEYPIPSGAHSGASISAGPDGKVWFAEYDGTSFYPHKIAKIDSAGNVTEYPAPLAQEPAQDNYDEIGSITKGLDGNLWVADPYHYTISKVTAAGSFTDFPYVTHTGGCPDTGCSGASSIVTAPDGNLWFTKYGAIGKMTTSGEYTEYPVYTKLGSPATLFSATVGADGKIWFTGTDVDGDSVGDSYLLNISNAGVISRYYVVDQNGGKAGVGPIALGPDNNIWISAQFQSYSAVMKFTPSGMATIYRDIFAYSIAAGPDGNLWLAQGGSVASLTTNGIQTVYPLDANKNGAGYIARGPDGNMWFTENTGYAASAGNGFVGKIILPSGATLPVCGSVSGVVTATAPSTNLCSTGSASPVSSSNSEFTWTCSLGGSTANCAAPRGYLVTPSAGANGSISPNTPQTVSTGATIQFTVTPVAGYTANIGGSCGGTLSGNIYTTHAIIANCTVIASFDAATTKFTVTPSADYTGSIYPNTPQLVSSGTTVQFTVTPNPDYTASVGGSCGGTLSGDIYTTSPITANCTVIASFAALNSAPTCTMTLNPTSLPSSGGEVSVFANCYSSYSPFVQIFIDGALSYGCGSLDPSSCGKPIPPEGFPVSLPSNTGVAPQTHVFSVVGTNPYGTGSASATVTVAMASSQINLDQRGLTGSWFNPATSGQGLELEVYPDVISPGRGVLFAGWFTYDVTAAGGRRWYGLQGNVSSAGSSATLVIFADVGGNLNAPPSVVPNGALGQATIQFSDCNTGSLTYSFTDGSGRAGTIPLTRITPNVTCSASGDNGAAASDYVLSGNWFNPDTSGQGLIFDFSPSLHLVFAAWYTFKPHGQQIGGPASQDWYTLQSDQFIPGISTLDNIPIVETNGGIFDNPATATTMWTGLADISFQSCNAMTLSYRFTAGENKGKTGSMNLVRVVPLSGCTLP